MLAERRYPLTNNTLERMMDLRLTVVSDDDTVFDLLMLYVCNNIELIWRPDGNEEESLSVGCKTIQHNGTHFKLTLLHSEELASPGSNSFWLSIHLVVYNEELAILEQTATEGKLKENQGCRVDTDQVHQNGDLKNRSVWIHPPGLQDVYTKET
ncbi:hypothetical protein Tco_0478961 [Tanacetum coccineum]